MTVIITGGLGSPLIITQGFGAGGAMATIGCLHTRDYARWKVQVNDETC